MAHQIRVYARRQNFRLAKESDRLHAVLQILPELRRRGGSRKAAGEANHRNVVGLV